MAAAAMALPLLFLAVAANAAGTLTERWLFFAEARHVVTLYYGAEQA
jgi:DMSO reductase anchor subunit